MVLKQNRCTKKKGKEKNKKQKLQSINIFAQVLYMSYYTLHRSKIKKMLAHLPHKILKIIVQ